MIREENLFQTALEVAKSEPLTEPEALNLDESNFQ